MMNVSKKVQNSLKLYPGEGLSPEEFEGHFMPSYPIYRLKL